MIAGHNVIVTWKKMKNLRLAVSMKDASVKVSAPYWSNLQEIEKFVVAQKAWLDAKQKEIANHCELRKKEFQNGAVCYLWGKKRELKVFADAEVNSGYEAKEDGISIEMRMQSDIDASAVEANLNDFYYREMIKMVPPYIEKWSEIMDVQISVCSFKRMKTRWGSCNPSLKKINLNTELAKFELGCLEYVIVHELAHFYEIRHNNRFWGIVEKAMPHWSIYHQKLNEHKID